MARYEFQVDKSFHRRRLDEFLFDRLSSLSKAYIRTVLKTGGCDHNGLPCNGGHKVLENDFIEIEVDESRTSGMRPEELPLKVLYEDASVLVIEKPAGMLVHPTNYQRNGTALNAMTHYLNRERKPREEFIRPHLIHRLDQETSGILVAAKDASSTRILCSHFKRGLIEKRYLAIACGKLNGPAGEIDLPIGRDPDLKKWMVMERGKPSLTRYKVIGQIGEDTLVELEPVTGRTNQLRIHLGAIGHPILGDEKQGGRPHERLCLHASRTVFWHPGGGRKVEVESRPDFVPV